MGHTKLGALPKSKKWIEVINLIDSDTDLSEIALAVLKASEKAFDKIPFDRGLILTYWLMTQIPLAAKKEDFTKALNLIDIHVSKEPGIFEIIASFNESIERQLRPNGLVSDISEMALSSASESLSAIVYEKSNSLFGRTSEDIKNVFASFAQSREFANLGREFFSRFTEKYLMYFLSKELSNHISEHKRFNDISSHEVFKQALSTYCWEIAKIVEGFSGAWYAKYQSEELSKGWVSGFLKDAVDKLKSELSMEDDNA